MAHGNTIVNGYGVELGSIAAHLLYLLTDNLSNLMQMGMARYKLSERVDNGYDGFAKLFPLHSCGHP